MFVMNLNKLSWLTNFLDLRLYWLFGIIEAGMNPINPCKNPIHGVS
jgi:hypothetical protein